MPRLPEPDLQQRGLPFALTIQDNFHVFHAANPWVYSEIVRMARDLKAKGETSWGLKAIFEVLRYYRRITTHTNEPFRLNNNYTSRYARLIEENEQDLRGFFAKRELKTS